MKAFFNKINLFNCKTLPRKIFTFYFIAILTGTIILMLPISRSANSASISFIDALFTASSAFSDTGLTTLNTGTYFSVFGQIIILILIQVGGIGLMALKVLLFLFLGKKIGLKERVFASTERGNGKLGGTIDLLKTSLVVVFSVEFIAAILFSLRYYFSYFNNPIFDRNILKVIFQGIFAAVSSTNNAGFDILGGESIVLFANDYFIQILTIICLVVGGLGFPFFYDIKNYIYCKKSKEKFHLSYFSKFILRVYFIITIISISLVFAIELTSGTILYNKETPLIQRIFYIIFNTFSTRSAGYATINYENFATGTQIIFSILMWIGAAPASTGGGIRITTFFICILSLIAYSKNKKETVFLGRKIPDDTVTKSLIVAFISQTLLFIVSIIIVASSPEITFIQAYFESCSAFGTTGLTLGITTQLSIVGKIAIILLMFIGQLGVSSTILMLSNNKTYIDKSTLPEEDILIN